VHSKAQAEGWQSGDGRTAALKALGDLGELQRRLEEERRMLKLYVIKAKQEWEERLERALSANGMAERRDQDVAADGATDDQEYYQASLGEVIGPNKSFKVEGQIGRGVFSSVFSCKHEKSGKEYAVKFIRSSAMMRKVSEKEVETYRHLARAAIKVDPEGAGHLVRLAGPETFEHRGHLCLVFALLKCDLRFGLQRYGQGKGLPMGTVRLYGRQLLLGLRALWRLKVIHADVKPDNVLMSMDKATVQLIDFGSSMGDGEQIRTSYVQPRYYRAPEVILGAKYGTPIDVWSLGVTLFELATGHVPLVGKTNNAMLHQMLETCGAFPEGLRKSGEFANRHFKETGDFLCQEPKATMPMARFKQPSKSALSLLETALKKPPPGADERRHAAAVQSFGDLVAKCVTVDPAKRVVPEHALAHGFFGGRG